MYQHGVGLDPPVVNVYEYSCTFNRLFTFDQLFCFVGESPMFLDCRFMISADNLRLDSSFAF